ncbi:MAG: NADPH-dependent oxidoreductase [Bacteroidetes bacterium]|nr:MAG: NADPH-dependent oxidoreductase [Bacteroidota bacterium]
MMHTIKNHRSIRKYKNKNIDDKSLNEILNAGIRASNTGNMQVYSIIVTRNEELKKQLWDVHFKQNMVLQAPVILTFCADINRFSKWCNFRDAEPGYDNFLWIYNATIDAILASQNVVLAAENKGLGICYLGTTTYMADKIVDILKLPKGVVPVTTITLGYPDENPELTDRLPLNGVIHKETYNDYTEDDINKIYEEKENLQETIDLIAENKTQNLAQIFTQKRYTKKDNVFFSNQFLELLKKQGFMNNK